MLKRPILLALSTCAALMSPSMAWAADDYRFGAQDDPVGDGSISISDSGGPAERLVDVSRVGVEHDARAGLVVARFEGKGLYGWHKSSMTLSLRLSEARGGRCDGGFQGNDVVLSGSESGRGYSGPEGNRSVGLTGPQGTEVASSGFFTFNDDVHATMTLSSQYLLRRDYRCVSAISASKVQQYFFTGGQDNVTGFALRDGLVSDGDIAPTITTDGSRLTWNQVESNTSYIVATSSAPEGSSGRSTTYTTVNGTTFTPPPAPGFTRYYGVRVNRPGSLWATPETAISFPVAVPSPVEPTIETPQNPATPLTPLAAPPASIITRSTAVEPAALVTPSGGTATGSASGSAPSTPSQPSASSAPRLTVKTVRSIVLKALGSGYGRSFSRRIARTYKVVCTSKLTKATCAVQWRYKRSLYKGKVYVTLTKQQTVTRFAIKRTNR